MFPATRDDDAHLLARLTAGDERALGAVFDTYGPVVYSLAFAITQHQATAESVVSDAFATVWREAKSANLAGRTLFSWLSGLVRSAALPKRADATPSLQPVAATQVAAAVERLSAVQRQVLELAYFGGFTRVDIARRLGVPEVDVATLLRGAMEALRDVLTPSSPTATQVAGV